jgi:arylsulfatase A-like enzyme
VQKKFTSTFILFSIALAGIIFVVKNQKNKLNSLPQKPNVVIVIVDDLNDWVSFLNKNTQAKTPYLDKIAKESLIFDYAYAPATLCNPSRTSIMTGKSPSSTGIYNNFRIGHNLLTHLGLKSLPELFKENKYNVYGAGKIFHASHYNDGFWDEYEKWVKPIEPEKDIKKNQFPYGVINYDESLMSDSKVLKSVENSLENKIQEPFFLTVGYSHPHFPWFSPQRFFDMYPLESIEVEELDLDDEKDMPRSGYNLRPGNQKILKNIIKQGNLEEITQAYLASISYVDEKIGLLFEALKQTPYYENTIFIFFSDHGFHLGSKNTFQKNTLWEDATHIPFLIHIPKESKIFNQHYPKTVNLIDIFPTLVDLCDLRGAASDLDGESLVNIIKDIDHKRNKASITTQGLKNHAIRKGDWKYIRYADAKEELYNIKKDPDEKTNLAQIAKYSSIKNDLAKELPKKNAKAITWFYEGMVKIPGKNRIKEFWIDETEVTNLKFRKFFQKTKYRTEAESKEINGSLVFNPNKIDDSEEFFNFWDFTQNINWHNLGDHDRNITQHAFYPVVHVTLEDAMNYCNYYKKRLATKSEWRLAASIDPNKIYAKGRWQANIFQGIFPSHDNAEDGFAGTAPVKSYKANKYGVYDMAGNVWEWTLGSDGKGYIMGGSFLCGDHCRGFDPQRSIEVDPQTSSDHIGFRCVKN